MKKSANAYFTVITIIGLLVAMIISSVAWFSANDFLYTNTVTLTSSDSLQMVLSIPSEQSNLDSYMGQIGIEYEGLDSPYCSIYDPVDLAIDLGDDKDYYMVCELTDVTIKLVMEEEEVLTTQEILSNFTWRFGIMGWQSVYNPETEEYENIYAEKFYKNNNGFLYDEETGQPLKVIDGMNYSLTYYLYFVGEEGFSIMQETESNIPSTYKFEFSDLSYMWSTFYVSINIGVRELYNINFESNGGSQCESIPTTGGTSVLLPTPTAGDETKYFGGWYDNPTFDGQPFAADTLLENPRQGDFTLYAKWLDKLTVTFDANGCTATMPDIQYIIPGGTPTNPGVWGDIVAWTATPTTYEEYLDNPNDFDFSQPITEDTTIYAVRYKHKITLHISHKKDGYLIVDDITYTDLYIFYVYEEATIPNIYTPVKDGNLGEFKKWSLENDAIYYIDAVAYNFNTPVTNDVHLYAYYS